MKNKNYIRQAQYLRNSIPCDHNFWYTCVKWWYLQALFFIFSKFWFSRVFSGVKWQEIVYIDKTFCPSRSISQEPYTILLPFVAHKCKMIIFPGFFHFIKISIFRVVRAVKKQKMSPNDTKRCPSYRISQEPYIIWSSFMVHFCKKIISPCICYIFSKI